MDRVHALQHVAQKLSKHISGHLYVCVSIYVYTFAWVFLDSIAQIALKLLFALRLTENIVWGPRAGIIYIYIYIYTFLCINVRTMCATQLH